MTEISPNLAAASDRLAKALGRLEAAIATQQTQRRTLKEERDQYKRLSLEEQEKFRGLQAAAFNVSTQIDRQVARIDDILKA